MLGDLNLFQIQIQARKERDNERTKRGSSRMHGIVEAALLQQPLHFRDFFGHRGSRRADWNETEVRRARGRRVQCRWIARCHGVRVLMD